MHNRQKKVIKMLAVILTAGIVYFFITQLGFSIPCMFHKVTGFYCPGCGVTRMCIKLIKFDFYGAFRCNPAVFICLPFLGVIYAIRCYNYLKQKSSNNNLAIKIIEIMCLVLLILSGILRNIPFFSFLAPH